MISENDGGSCENCRKAYSKPIGLFAVPRATATVFRYSQELTSSC